MAMLTGNSIGPINEVKINKDNYIGIRDENTKELDRFYTLKRVRKNSDKLFSKP